MPSWLVKTIPCWEQTRIVCREDLFVQETSDDCQEGMHAAALARALLPFPSAVGRGCHNARTVTEAQRSPPRLETF